MDYTKYALSGRYYTGAERKKGILIDGEAYIVKYARELPDGISYSHVSEYIGSHLFAHAGVETQQTMLGSCDKKQVVVMKDFIGVGETFVPFNDVGDSTLEQDRERYRYSYDDIIEMLTENSKLTNVEETCRHFWNMYVVDAWIGNFDRHGANWGFLKKNNQYRIAPVYDNGSSLFPKLNTDDKLREVLQSAREMEKRVFQFPTSQILLGGKKSSYYEVISSLQFQQCNEAVCRMYERINLDWVKEFIEGMEMLSPLRRQFYVEMLKIRYEKMICEPYFRLKGERE